MSSIALDLARTTDTSASAESATITTERHVRRLPIVTDDDAVLLPSPSPIDVDPDSEYADYVGEEDDEDGAAEGERQGRVGIRARTISVKRLSKRALMRGKALYPETKVAWPQTRAQCLPEARSCPHCGNDVVMSAKSDQITCPDCRKPVVYMALRGAEYGEWVRPEDAPTDMPDTTGLAHCRPCLKVSCTFNLFLDVNKTTGSIKLNFPDLEPHEMVNSCALDVADQRGITLEDVGEVLNLTRERVRQLETKGIEKLKAQARADKLVADLDRAMGVESTVSQSPMTKLADMANHDFDSPSHSLTVARNAMALGNGNGHSLLSGYDRGRFLGVSRKGDE